MTVTPQETREYLELRERSRRQEGARRAAKLREKLGEVSRLLRSRYGAETIWLFGSLAVGQVSPESDVDIAVAGIDPRRFFDAMAEISALVESNVDLVLWERAPESLRVRIREEGELL